MDVLPMAHDERADLADLLESLSEEQWNGESLCERWRIRDVVAHIVSYDDVPLPAVASMVLRGRLRPDRINAIGISKAASLSTEELLKRFRAHLTPPRLVRGFGGAIGLVDGLIHHQDIRRPLQLPRAVPAERLKFVLDFAVGSPMLPARRLSRGLRLVATDLDWSRGRGPDVRGPAEPLLMAIAGRRGVSHELTGDGQQILCERTGG